MKIFTEIYSEDGQEHAIIDILQSDLLDAETRVDALKFSVSLRNLLTAGGEYGLEFTLTPIQASIVDHRKLAGELFNHATNGAKMAQNLAEAETLKAEIKAKFAVTDDLYELKIISAELQVALKVIESGGKLGLVRDEETGKLKTKGGKSGNGDRANPLPPIEETCFIQSGKNGDTVIAIKTEFLAGVGNKKSDAFKPNMWQAFRLVDGKYGNWGALCSSLDCSWSKVNQEINNRVRLNTGKNVGTGGMLEVSRTNVETALGQCGHSIAD